MSIYSGQRRWRGVARSERPPLTSDDAYALMRDAPTLKSVVPTLGGDLQVKYGAKNARVEVVATTPEFATISRLATVTGRFFGHADDYARRRVAVLGAAVPADLDADAEELIGQPIAIRGITFAVVGVLDAKGEQPGPDPDESVYIPFRTGEYRIFGSDRLQGITVQLLHPDSMEAALLEIETVLRREHRLHPDEENDFRIRDRSQFLTVQAETSATL